jgi:hypothetical protein
MKEETTLDVDDELDDKASWARSAMTRKLSKFYDTKRESAFQALMGACGISTDPRVAKAYGEYTMLAAVAATLKGKESS